ncbi:MAG TPA: TolC family protein [Blastocatellia bacterium]|jgi:HAE1 family hydrophobic/amphiphilic exporter-1|nr:TolC family protein [Blastocatellia bacterium]
MNNNWLRATAREFTSLSLWPPCLTVFCAVFFASLISMPAAAQDTQTPPSSNIQTENIVSRPIPQRTVGLEPGKIVQWTLRDAILAALEKSVDIQLEQENVRMAQYSLISAQGAYDPTVSSTIIYNKSTQATAFRAAGIDQGSNTISRDATTYNFGMRKNLERWGSLLDASFENQRLVSNTNDLTTQYAPSMTINLTQPLFKNFSIDQSRRSIKLAQKQLALNDAQFRARVIQIILQVEQAYWNLAAAIRNEVVRRESVGLAETFLNNTKRQVEVGTLPPIDVVSAATQLESRRQEVFAAMNNVGIAENELKRLTADGTEDPIWSSAIEPTEPFDVKPMSIPVADAIKVAHENRPEIQQMSVNKDINKINIDFFRNQAKPEINFIGFYSTSGLGGSPRVRTGPNCSPVLNPATGQMDTCADVGVGVVNGVLAPVVTTAAFNPALSVTSPIGDRFVGGYGAALSNMFKNDFRTWQVGIQINLPLRNRTAKANLGSALEAERQRDLQNRQLLQLIEVEVRNAVQEVETAKMRIDAASEATRFAVMQLEGEEKKFAAGLTPTYFVLDRQNQLSMARISELNAKVDYNKALANLRRVMSTTLTENSISLPQGAPVTIK